MRYRSGDERLFWPVLFRAGCWGFAKKGSGYTKKQSCDTYTVWPGCLVVTGCWVWTLAVSVPCFSEGLLRGWSFWKGLVPGWMRRREPPSRMYTCSGATSSQRGPWKPERHTQVCGRLQEPRFWQGGWQSAEERAQMEIECQKVMTCMRVATLVWMSSSSLSSQHQTSFEIDSFKRL